MTVDDFFGEFTANQIIMIASSVMGFAVMMYTTQRNNKIKPNPKAWQKAGTLKDITCYPIKSCGGVKMKKSECSILGLKDGFLRDRVFMVVNNDGKFVTGRALPKLTQIKPSVEGSIMTLKAKNMADISINIANFQSHTTIKSRVWGQTVDVVDCGNPVAKWLTQVLLEGIEPGLRLVYYPKDVSTRTVRPNIFDKTTTKDVGALTDATSYSLLTQGSVNDLNSRLDVPVMAHQFRGNFFVDSEKPFAEDDWTWVRIGDVVFQNIRPCTRCLFTTVDPDTGVTSLNKEPLKTLETYRKLTDPAIVRFAGHSPVLGIHMALVGSGTVSVGDMVYVQ